MQPLPPEQRELLSTGILQEPFKVYPDVYSTSKRTKSQTGSTSFRGPLCTVAVCLHFFKKKNRLVTIERDGEYIS